MLPLPSNGWGPPGFTRILMILGFSMPLKVFPCAIFSRGRSTQPTRYFLGDNLGYTIVSTTVEVLSL